MAKTDKPTVETTYPITHHLRELRKRVVYVLVILTVVFCFVYWKSDYVYRYLIKPLNPYIGHTVQLDNEQMMALTPTEINALIEEATKDSKVRLITISVTEAFFTELMFSFAAALVFCMPFILFQAWRFVAPGLYKEERRYLFGFIISASFLFCCGAMFVYHFVFPLGFKLFTSYTDKWEGMQVTFSIAAYFGFVTKLMIAFGAVFELPVVVFFLTKMGIVNTEMMRKYRKYSILGIFIIAAILTPPDLISQIAMAIPLIILYEISIWITKIFGVKAKEADQTVDIYE